MAWLTASAHLLYPAYHSQSITAADTVTITAAPQSVIRVGTSAALSGGITISLSAADLAASRRAALLLVDETGTLTATALGAGQVSGAGTNAMLLTGTGAELTSMLATLRVTEAAGGPDTLQITAFNTEGQAGSARISLLAMPSGGTDFSFANTAGTQTWSAATAHLAPNGSIASETL